jgi:hypothetical protein
MKPEMVDKLWGDDDEIKSPHKTNDMMYMVYSFLTLDVT